ncbi:hypothetical protein [Candidatus Uabimicrobium sp. HlEnr_7]|uniref:hypothetical protein n=1 Tax=Candidatus Uabimicrobium helgolandensis TaxID=3095367 RepID=UPI003555E97C
MKIEEYVPQKYMKLTKVDIDEDIQSFKIFKRMLRIAIVFVPIVVILYYKFFTFALPGYAIAVFIILGLFAFILTLHIPFYFFIHSLLKNLAPQVALLEVGDSLFLRLFFVHTGKFVEYNFSKREIIDIEVTYNEELSIKNTQYEMTFIVNKYQGAAIVFRMVIEDIRSRDRVLDFMKRLCQILELPRGDVQQDELQFLKMHFSKSVATESTNNVIDTEDVDKEENIAELYASGENIKNESRGIDAEKWSPDVHILTGKIISYVPNKELAVHYKQGDEALFLILARVVGIVAVGGFLQYLFASHLFLNASLVIAFFDASKQYKKAREKKLFDPDQWYFNLQQKKIYRTLKGECLEYDMAKANRVLFYKITTTTEHTDSDDRTTRTSRYKSIIKLQGIGETGYLKVAETPNISNSEESYKNGLAFTNFISQLLEIPMFYRDETHESYANIERSHGKQ